MADEALSRGTQSRAMKFGFRAASYVAAASAVVVISFMGWLLYGDMQRENEAEQWAGHAQSVLRNLALTREFVARLESAKRAFILSGDRGHLAERDHAATELHALVTELERLTRHTPDHHLRATLLAEAVRERIAFSSGNTAPSAEAMLRVVHAAHAASEKVYRAAGELEAQEARTLQQRRGEQLREQAHGANALAALLAVFVALVAAAYVVAHRTMRDRERIERRMADIVENLPLTVWQVRRDAAGQSRFAYVSANARSERGVSADALLDDFALAQEAIVEEDRELVRAAVLRAERERRPLDVTYRVRCDDEVRWLHSRATVRPQDDGSVLWSGFWRDVTHDRELEQELHTVNRELEAFSYTVSHDLRTPLAAVSAFTAALLQQEGAALSERARGYVDRIRSSAEQMRELIAALLSLSRLARQPLRRETVDLSAMAREVVDQLRHAEPQRRVAVDVLPGLAAAGDPALLRQVLANLLGNAWKFTADTPDARIEVASTRHEGHLCFVVRDNGIGFDAERAARLFQPFARFHRADDFPGTGIGLATVWRIVSRHGGRVWAESRPGDGARFCFTVGELPSPVAA